MFNPKVSKTTKQYVIEKKLISLKIFLSLLISLFTIPSLNLRELLNNIEKRAKEKVDCQRVLEKMNLLPISLKAINGLKAVQ